MCQGLGSFLLAGILALPAAAERMIEGRFTVVRDVDTIVVAGTPVRLVILLTSVLTAFAVCFVGAIGFVGIIAPHVARQFVGEDQRFFLPVSALVGAVVVSFAFVVSKLAIPGVVLPIGLVTAAIGIPLFLAIIFNRMRVM